jgi:hypothetical protein
MLVMSGLYPLLEMHSHDPNGNPLAIYGDPAYSHRIHLQCPYKGANLTQAQLQFNKSMSSVRVAVEWPFGEIATYFAFNDFKKNLKIGLQSVAKIYTVSCLMFNAKTCLYGSQTSQFFRLVPPHLDEYFSQSM